MPHTARQDRAGPEEGDGTAQAADPAQARDGCGCAEGGSDDAHLRGGGGERAAGAPAHRRQRREEEPVCQGKARGEEHWMINAYLVISYVFSGQSTSVTVTVKLTV